MDAPQQMLRRRGLLPKKSWGQNFLGDADTLERIARAAELRPGDVAVELGSGLGHLTERLLATGASVVAIERDRDMVRILEEQALPNLRVIAANAADTQFAQVAGVASVVVVGNLPYHLSSSILFEVLQQRETISRAVFTLQKEVVTRLVARPGGRDYGLLSVLLGLSFDLEELFVIPARFFHPPPKVDSAVIRLTRLAAPRAEVTSHQHFVRVVKAAFAQRRKTLINSLSSDASLGNKDFLALALERARIDPTRRAETLSPAEFAAVERSMAQSIG